MPNPNLQERYSRCPYCGKVLEFRYAPPYEYGCPRIVCLRCGKQHFDGFYREKALVEYQTRAPMWNIWICAAFVAYSLYFDYTVLQMDPEIIMLETAAAAVLLPVISISLLLIALHRREHREEYVSAKEKKLEERFRNAERVDRDLFVSLNRLGNEEYLYYLIDNEVEVPDYFFRRAGLCRNEERIRKMQRKRELQNEKKRLQDELEYYEYYLSLGTEDRIFRQQAQSKGMEFKTFEDFCRKQVELYRTKLIELHEEESTINN